MDEAEKTVIEVVTEESGESEEGEAVPVLTSDNIKENEGYGVAECPSSKRNDKKWIESSISVEVRRGCQEERAIDSKSCAINYITSCWW